MPREEPLLNRLAQETSPYLRLHAGNPVDWYSWGEEAFARARHEDKPIFLSVGYSTCHWCHVMERESFADPEIARQLNRDFVSIKVDREERPDIDEVYMTATQLLTGTGGWPNSLFLTADLKPFVAGTYFPPRDQPGRAGFPRVLAAVRSAWDEQRPTVLDQAEAVARAVCQQVQLSERSVVPASGTEVARDLLSTFERQFDPEWGGFSEAPKFPSPGGLFFLLDRAPRSDSARRMLLVTLRAMARGGIHDHLGGGFHRYSTDRFWRVPHFEKMIYDNAVLAELYAEAALLAPDEGFETVARRTLEFVLAELRGEHGAFLSAIDAETEGEEGTYYTFTDDELAAFSGSGDWELFTEVYGLSDQPDFEGRRHLLHLDCSLAEHASQRAVSRADLDRRLDEGRRALLACRGRKPRPFVDDKVLTDWNGLTIAALARCGTLLREPAYAKAAAAAAEFILVHLRQDEEGELLHCYRQGVAKVPGLLDDYAFLVRGLLALDAAGDDRRWLDHAIRLQAEQDRRLGDADAGGYFAAGENSAPLVRGKPVHDGASLSGNGVAALNLFALAHRTGEPAFLDAAKRLLSALDSAVAAAPNICPTLVRALLTLESVGRPKRAAARRPSALMEEARSVVRSTVRWGEKSGRWRRFVLTLEIEAGWHLAGVQVRGSGIRGLRFSPRSARSGDARSDAQAYSDRLRIKGEAKLNDGRTPPLLLEYQACDQNRCLPTVIQEVMP